MELQTTGTWMTDARRTTTSWSGIAAGQSLLDQMWSWPELISMTTVSGETCQVHASLALVCRLSWKVTSLPPMGAATVAVMKTSPSEHGPLGSGSTGVG